jgi:hypothetical protein
LFGLSLVVMNVFVANDLVWTNLAKNQYLIVVAVVTHFVPFYTWLLEKKTE